MSVERVLILLRHPISSKTNKAMLLSYLSILDPRDNENADLFCTCPLPCNMCTLNATLTFACWMMIFITLIYLPNETLHQLPVH